MCWQQFIAACAVCVITMGLCAMGDCDEGFSAMFAPHHITASPIG
jgi:hypothetical protein